MNVLWDSTLGSFTPVWIKTPRNRFNGELRGAQSRSGRVVGEKNSWLLPRIKIRFLGSTAAPWILSTRNVWETPVFARIADFQVQENCNSNKMTCAVATDSHEEDWTQAVNLYSYLFYVVTVKTECR
jgi:hypothetical protein